MRMNSLICSAVFMAVFLSVARAEPRLDAAAREQKLAEGVFQVTKEECVIFASKAKPEERLALLFTKFAKGQATYRWLYFNPLTKDWVSGAGRLQEVYDKVQTGDRGLEVITVPGHNTKIQAGKIAIEWSRGSETSGWLYFRPEHLAFEALPAEEFRSVVNRAP